MPEDISKISDEELMARIQRLREVRIPSPQGQGKKSRPRRLDDAPSKRRDPRGLGTGLGIGPSWSRPTC